MTPRAFLPVLLAPALMAQALAAPVTLEGEQARQSPQAEAFTRCMQALQGASPSAIRRSYASGAAARIEYGLAGPQREKLLATMTEKAAAGLASSVTRVVTEGDTAKLTLEPKGGGTPGAFELEQVGGRWLCKTLPQ